MKGRTQGVHAVLDKVQVMAAGQGRRLVHVNRDAEGVLNEQGAGLGRQPLLSVRQIDVVTGGITINVYRLCSGAPEFAFATTI